MNTQPKVLLVEDNAGDVTLLKLAMKRVGFESSVTHLPDGEHALRYLSRAYNKGETNLIPDLLLLDLNLPRVSGLEILRELKSHPGMSKLPVFVLTSSEADKDFDEVLGLSANWFFSKPSHLQGYESICERLKSFVESQNAKSP